jgi:hypothetical protein
VVEASLTSACDLLPTHLAVRVRAAVPREACTRWAAGVLGARDEWTEDFDGAQFCLGRPFYTHLETDRTDEYFGDAADTDARVERNAAGLQSTMRDIVAQTVRARVVQRAGWCGAGVHVFPAGGELALSGGVVHFDTEGLTAWHVARRAPALSFVLMLQPPATGGGLRLWSALYAGRDTVDDATLRACAAITVPYDAGDVVLFDSYRCHRIQPFTGDRDRISTTLHAAQIDRALWETWF